MMKYVKALEKAGLVGKQAKIYYSLLKSGEATASYTAAASGVERTLAYKVLAELQSMGLVSFSVRDGKKYFSAAPPDAILEDMRERYEDFRSIVPTLKTAGVKVSTDAVRTEVYTGKKAAKVIMKQMLASGKDYISAGGGFDFGRMFPNFSRRMMQKIVQRKIKERIIVPEGTKISVKSENSEIRYLPMEHPLLGGFVVSGDSVILLIHASPLTMVSIENPGLSRTFAGYFETMWKAAKE